MWPSGLGNYFVCKRFAVHTLLWSLEFAIQINLEHDTIAVNNNISKTPVVCTDKNIHNTPANQFKYVQLKTYDTFYNGYINSKNYINDVLKILDLNNNFDNNPNLVKTNSDTNSKNQLGDRINEFQEENKH